jgi:ubiquinone/menaquinone biosynthesis C-methylase UbiE
MHRFRFAALLFSAAATASPAVPPGGLDAPGPSYQSQAGEAARAVRAPGPTEEAQRLLELKKYEQPPHYEFRREHDPNGTGKFYMGREIAHVMGHQAAEWLERPEREQEERTSLLIEMLKFQPGEVVADIGAGTGYVSSRIAQRVGEKGGVYAVEIQPEMLDIIERKMRERGIRNVKPSLGTPTDPCLPPESCDTIIMVDVYHEFDRPFEMTQSMVQALKPGGRLVFVEFRAEDPNVPIKSVHKMSEAQVKKEMSAFPQLEWKETLPGLPWQHVIVFRKK